MTKIHLAEVCNATRRLGDGKRVILRHRVRGSVRAVKAVRNTLVFLTETIVVAYVLSLTSTIPFSTVLSAMMMILHYRRGSSAVAFWCVIAVIAPLAFLLAIMILM